MPDLEEKLEEYVAKIKDRSKSLHHIKEDIAKTEHVKLIMEICDNLILNLEEKTNAVMAYGAPNSGKT